MRFYFDFLSHNEEIRDCEGVELADWLTAHRHAVQIVKQTVPFLPKGSEWRGASPTSRQEPGTVPDRLSAPSVNKRAQSQQIGSAEQDRLASRMAGNNAANDHRPNGNHDGLDLRRATSTTGADPEGLD